jgi:hypothetical protein
VRKKPAPAEGPTKRPKRLAPGEGKKSDHSSTSVPAAKKTNARAKGRTLPDRKAVLDTAALSHSYGLSRTTLARMLGLSEGELALREKEQAAAGAAVRERFRRVERILQKAAAAMRREYVPTWIDQPSPACAEFGARAPIDLMERGDYDTVENLLFFLGSGVPY